MKKTVLTIFACAISLAAAPKLYTAGSSGGGSELSATIYSKNESAVSSKISGYVKKIYVEEGENVKKGAPLFEIDAASTQAAALSANANYLGAKAAADDAKRDFGRYKNLFEKGVVSEKEFERAKLNYEIKAQMMASSQAMLSQAKNEQGYSLVRAPIDGVVLKKYMTVASMAMPGQPVLLLSGKGDLRLKADIYEQELQNFKVGQTINFKVGSKTEEAKVISIASSGGTARNFTLRAEPKKQDGLYSGMFVKLVASAGVGQISLPINTLTKRGGIVGVFELANGTAKFRAVKIKRQSGDFAIVEGVSVGTKIIENPKENLQDGQKAE